MAPILAAILFFKITGMFEMIFDSFIGSGMVENIYLDSKTMTLSPLLRKLEVSLDIQGLRRLAGKREGPEQAQSSQVTRRPDPGRGPLIGQY